MTQTARQIVLAARPQGLPKTADFRLEQVRMPTLPRGGVMLRVLYISLDPYVRVRMDDCLQLGATIPAEGVAEVMASDCAGYKAGDIVLAPTGWRTHAASNGLGLRQLDPELASVTTALGVLGMPGFAAYSGLAAIGRPLPGETVVVASAAGPVGSVVGQLARIAGCRAVGIAGGADKCRYVRHELGFDAAVDRHLPHLAERLAAVCPYGIDIYFENVGGVVWQAALTLLNRYARVPVCGLIEQYNRAEETAEERPATMREVLVKRLNVRGFTGSDFVDKYFFDFLSTMSPAVAEGRIRYREHIAEGLENAPRVFIETLLGQNFGQAIVRVG